MARQNVNTIKTMEKERGVKEALEILKVDEKEYGETFRQIANEWERALGTADYLRQLVNPAIKQICKTPDDFLKASKIILDGTKKVWGDGSYDFIKILMQEIENGYIDSLGKLQLMCNQLVQKNKAATSSKRYEFDGTQFRGFIEEIRESIERTTVAS